MSTSRPSLLVRYVAFGRLASRAGGSNVIVASHATGDDLQDNSTFASWFRTLIDEHRQELFDYRGSRFHKVVTGQDDASKNGMHINWVSEQLGDEKDNVLLVFYAICTDKYPERTPGNGPAHLLWELKENLMKKFADQIGAAQEGGSVHLESQSILEAIFCLQARFR